MNGATPTKIVDRNEQFCRIKPAIFTLDTSDCKPQFFESTMPMFGSNPKKISTRSKNTSKKSKSKTTPKKHARRRNETFNLYIHRVLRRVSPDNAISKRSMLVMNSLVSDMYTRVTQEAVRLMRAAGRSTLTATDVDSAVQILFPGELATHATNWSNRAVSLFVEAE